MKKYEIEINNDSYRVSVKELSADADMSNQQTTPRSEPQKIYLKNLPPTCINKEWN